jgi:hypothetical protein
MTIGTVATIAVVAVGGGAGLGLRQLIHEESVFEHWAGKMRQMWRNFH